MIVHIFSSLNTVYMKTFMKFLKGNKFKQEHKVIIWVNERLLLDINKDLTLKCSLLKVWSICKNADKIIFHSLFCPDLIFCFCFFKKLLNKSYWVIWGADLHFYRIYKNNIKYRILEFFRCYFIKNICGVATGVDDDYKLLKKWYAINAKHFNIIYALDPKIVNLATEISNKKSNKLGSKRRILLGNSATTSNGHFEIIDILYERNCEFDELICPLSYGDMEYAEKVVKYGKNKFGEKFISLNKYYSQEEYVKMINTVDIAIFNSIRQQALGNIFLLALLKKKIYLNSNSENYHHFVLKDNYKFYPIESIDRNLFLINDDDLFSNQQRMISLNSNAHQLELWNRIFEDKDC